MDCSTPGFPVHHQLPKLTETRVHQVCDAIQPTQPIIPFFCLQAFPASGSFPVSQLFTSGGQSIGVSASTSFLPMNIQDWFPLGWAGWISLQSKGLRLLIFLPTILIPACASSSLAFYLIYSGCKLNKQGDSKQPWCTPLLIWNQSVVPCPVLTIAYWPAYRFLRRHAKWSSIPIS